MRIGRLLAASALLLTLVVAVPASSAPSVPSSPPVPPVPASCGQLEPVTVAGAFAGCTHGPDPAPPGVDPSAPRPLTAESSEPVPAVARGTGDPAIPCYGDGQDGPRVQAVYAYPSDRPDRYTSVLPSIVRWAAEVDQVVAESARRSGGVRRVRFVTDANCQLVVLKVRLSPEGDDNLTTTMSEFAAQGLNRRDRKYLTWMDSTVLCGVAGYYLDDRPDQSNANNGTAPGTVARTDSGCWGLGSSGQSVEAHELVHVLGGVQPSAPHSTPLGHCTDDSDRMCYQDGSPGLRLDNVCPGAGEALLDCRHDDYFSTAPAAGSYLATHWNTARSSFLATADPNRSSSTPDSTDNPPPPPSSPPPEEEQRRLPVTPQASGRFQLLPPARVLDTREANGARAGRLGPGEAVSVQMTGRGGVPQSGVGGVLLNLTVTAATAPGAVTAFPAGRSRPPVPSVLFPAGRTVPNLVVVPVGEGGRVSFHNAEGQAHVIADVVGWFDSADTDSAPSRFSSLPPTRLLDTRNGTGGRTVRLGPGEAFALQVTGRGGVPAVGVAGAVLNVTVTQPTASGYLTASPTGQARPRASNLNFVPGQTVPNLVAVPVGPDGRVSLFNSHGTTHVVADVVGWFDNGSDGARSRVESVPPARLLDTRDGTGGPREPLGNGQVVTVQVTGRGGVPSSGVAGVVVNAGAHQPTAAGYLTLYPHGAARPTASNVNFVAGQRVANLTFVPVGKDGRVDVFHTGGRTHVTLDIVGWLDE
jgi:hypothetical protein